MGQRGSGHTTASLRANRNHPLRLEPTFVWIPWRAELRKQRSQQTLLTPSGVPVLTSHAVPRSPSLPSHPVLNLLSLKRPLLASYLNAYLYIDFAGFPPPGLAIMEFINPPPSGPDGDFSGNPIYPPGKVVNVAWTPGKEDKPSSLTLWQLNATTAKYFGDMEYITRTVYLPWTPLSG